MNFNWAEFMWIQTYKGLLSLLKLHELYCVTTGEMTLNCQFVIAYHACYGPVTLGRIDLTYKKRMFFVNVRFMFFLCPLSIRQMCLC